MRLAFMGTPPLSADILFEISEQHEVVCVFTMPDKVRGRGKTFLPSPVKEMAQKLDIPVRTPITLKDDTEISFIESLDLDAICVAAYGHILPESILRIPKYGCLNVHTSLLPKWRGAAPIERTILSGDSLAGVCIMKMEKGLDTGDFCIRRSIDASNKSYLELTEELAMLGAQALLVALSQIEQGNVIWTKQDEELATYADKISKGELDLDPSLPLKSNLLQILASSSAHPARFALGDLAFTAIAAAGADEDIISLIPKDDTSLFSSGSIFFTKKRLILKCADGWIEITTLKPDGRKEMSASAFLAGAHLLPNTKWGRIEKA